MRTATAKISRTAAAPQTKEAGESTRPEKVEVPEEEESGWHDPPPSEEPGVIPQGGHSLQGPHSSGGRTSGQTGHTVEWMSG